MREYIDTLVAMNDRLSIATMNGKCYWGTKDDTGEYYWDEISNELYVQLLDIAEDREINVDADMNSRQPTAYKTD